MTRILFLAVILVGMTPAVVAQTPGNVPHQDHEPKHGGTFFMAMNSHHHLEGVLEGSGVFRVYVYDAYTKPLTLDRMKQVTGVVQVGDSDEPPEVALTLSRDGMTLEAELGDQVRPPVTLTLLARFPGMASESRPELFTFTFREYTEPAATGWFWRTFGPIFEGIWD